MAIARHAGVCELVFPILRRWLPSRQISSRVEFTHSIPLAHRCRRRPGVCSTAPLLAVLRRSPTPHAHHRNGWSIQNLDIQNLHRRPSFARNVLHMDGALRLKRCTYFRMARKARGAHDASVCRSFQLHQPGHVSCLHWRRMDKGHFHDHISHRFVSRSLFCSTPEFSLERHFVWRAQGATFTGCPIRHHQ